MKKIPSIFERDWNGDKSRVTAVCNSEALWVFKGEGVPTRKFDGTAVRILNGELWVRYDAKNGKTPPDGFEPAMAERDEKTGHWAGWLKAGDNPQYKWQRAAFEFSKSAALLSGDGTYEACGPHFQANPEGYAQDCLIRHGEEKLENVPTTHAELSEWFKGRDIEGIVWWHPDGRMAKIKASDFGLRRRAG